MSIQILEIFLRSIFKYQFKNKSFKLCFLFSHGLNLYFEMISGRNVFLILKKQEYKLYLIICIIFVEYLKTPITSFLHSAAKVFQLFDSFPAISVRAFQRGCIPERHTPEDNYVGSSHTM